MCFKAHTRVRTERPGPWGQISEVPVMISCSWVTPVRLQCCCLMLRKRQLLLLLPWGSDSTDDECLSVFGLLQQRTTQSGLQTSACISHSSGGWEVQDQGGSRYMCGERPLPGSQMANFNVNFCGRRGREALGGLFYVRILIPFMKTLPS